MDYYWTITGLLLDHDFLVYLLIGSSLDYIGFMMIFKVFYKDLARQTLQQIKGLSSDFHHNVLSLGSGRKGEEGKPWLMLIYIYSFIIIFIISIVYNYIVI